FFYDWRAIVKDRAKIRARITELNHRLRLRRGITALQRRADMARRRREALQSKLDAEKDRQAAWTDFNETGFGGMAGVQSGKNSGGGRPSDFGHAGFGAGERALADGCELPLDGVVNEGLEGHGTSTEEEAGRPGAVEVEEMDGEEEAAMEGSRSGGGGAIRFQNIEKGNALLRPPAVVHCRWSQSMEHRRLKGVRYIELVMEWYSCIP
ncbi:hypothetical protein FOZ63_003815, partial [Perkinsus olseni]